MSFTERLKQAGKAIVAVVNPSIRNVETKTWFGPNQPIDPVAQEETQGRTWQYPVGWNIRITPRGDELVSFATLRQLADTNYLVRLAIETRKDQMCRQKWTIKPIDPKQKTDGDKRLLELQQFFAKPDQTRTHKAWKRVILEDLLVCDAPTAEIRRDYGGRIIRFDPIDGATIAPKLDADGRRPAPPDVAYQQVLYGVPANNLSTAQLIYEPRNPRSWKGYGMSPVEQIILIINTSLRREVSRMQFYTEGTLPDGIGTMPESYTQDMVKEFQEYWDTILEGNTAQRRKIRWVPFGVKMDWPKKELLKDEFDDYLARVVCYAFSLSYSAFVTQVNRATAEESQSEALMEGREPLMSWWADFMNILIQEHFGYKDLHYVDEEDSAIEPDLQANIDSARIDSGVRSINEVRSEHGKDPIPGGNVHFIRTGGGIVLVESLEDPENLRPLMPAGAPPAVTEEVEKLLKAAGLKKKLSSPSVHGVTHAQ